MIQEEAEAVKSLAKPVYDALIKLGWGGWKELKVGEWFYFNRREPYEEDNAVHLIPNHSYVTQDLPRLANGGWTTTPILHWETIERILEGVEHNFYVENKRWGTFSCNIRNSMNRNIWTEGKSRQEAVMRGVIQLGKEINAKTK